MNPSLTIPFQALLDATAERPRVWLELEQDLTALPVETGEANLTDLVAMYNLARSGIPAATYRKTVCPVEYLDESTAVVTLPFFVWPSVLGLPYSLDGGRAEISGPELVEIDRDFDLVVGLTDRVDMGLLFDGTATWQTPCIDRYGRVVSPPRFVIENGQVVLDAEVFGVLRMTGRAKGYRHQWRLEIAAVDENRVSGLRGSVIASYQDGGKLATKTLDLEIPACVQDALATCPDDGKFQVFGSVTTVERQTTVYYSTCTGHVLDVRYERQD